ncbi:hypothetical protein ACFSTE_04640 [Aquimarina hainanensis]|uniref:Uncharacterized protein n=1 Tax=Aquimarina hainanensis TaxID=1578017 RepID=A0ABW5N4S5_9FLAO
MIGQKIQLVAECANLEGKEVVFKIYEKEPLLVTKDKELSVLQNGTEVTEIKATVTDGYAVTEVELQKVNQGKYKDWDKILDPDTGDLKTTYLFIKVSCEGAELPIVDKRFLNRNGREFKLRTATHLYEICSNGQITKYHRNEAGKGRYYYIDNSDTKHFLGRYIYKKIKSKYYYKSKKYGDKYVNLVDFRNVKNYHNGNIKFKVTLNTERPYLNEITLASVFGAMLECGYDDFTYNGFSLKDGAPGISKSHKNDYNGDFRYLRKDKSGKNVYLNKSSEKGDPCGWKGMDEVRQNKFNDALYKFGWKDMLSWKYNNKLLKHCKHYKNHHHHLHVQDYKPNLTIKK